MQNSFRQNTATRRFSCQPSIPDWFVIYLFGRADMTTIVSSCWRWGKQCLSVYEIYFCNMVFPLTLIDSDTDKYRNVNSHWPLKGLRSAFSSRDPKYFLESLLHSEPSFIANRSLSDSVQHWLYYYRDEQNRTSKHWSGTLDFSKVWRYSSKREQDYTINQGNQQVYLLTASKLSLNLTHSCSKPAKSLAPAAKQICGAGLEATGDLCPAAWTSLHCWRLKSGSLWIRRNSYSFCNAN